MLGLVGQATGMAGVVACGGAAGLTELLEFLGSVMLGLRGGVGVVQCSLVAACKRRYRISSRVLIHEG